MPSSRFLLLLVAISPAVISCAGASVVAEDNSISHQVARIAMSASGGEFADAIVKEMRDSEQNTAEVMDTHSTMELLERLGMKNIHATLPEGLELLRADGIDAWMKAAEAAHPTSDTPQSVDIVLTSTHDLRQFIKFTWINAWGGMKGSIADAVMRKGRTAAAKAVADEIVRRLHSDQ
jgi:hypothetical protein